MKLGQNFVKYFVRFCLMQFQEKILLRFTDLYLRRTKFNEKTLERGKKITECNANHRGILVCKDQYFLPHIFGPFSCLGQFEQSQTSWDKFRPIWTIQGKFEQFLTKLTPWWFSSGGQASQFTMLLYVSAHPVDLGVPEKIK